MSSTVQIDTADTSGLFGHPVGLGTLFFTELWERFSYYGMRAILVLYMVAPVAAGGLGFDVKHAASIYGTYTMSVYLTALPGGMVCRPLARRETRGPARRHRDRLWPFFDGLSFHHFLLPGHGLDCRRHGIAQTQHQRDARESLRQRRPSSR